MNRKHFNLFTMCFTSAMLLALAANVASAHDEYSFGLIAETNASASVQKGGELWVQVNTCIQNAIKTGFNPNPWPVWPLPTPTCVYVQPQGAYANIGDGFSIVKAKDKHIYHFLTLPTKAITGIEDPQVDFFLTPSAVNTSYSPNYWVPAWTWLNSTVAVIYNKQTKRTLRPDQMGLAINSPQARTQNQLHIHLACINKAVQTALAANKLPISTCAAAPCKWSEPIPIPIAGKSTFPYRVVILSSLSLNPFLVMQSIPHFDAGKTTLIATAKPATKPGPTQYYLLQDYSHTSAGISDNAFGERLLDEDCATQ